VGSRKFRCAETFSRGGMKVTRNGVINVIYVRKTQKGFRDTESSD
jgi:hypothetical protein